MTDEVVPVMCHHGGKVVMQGRKPDYEGGVIEGIPINKSCAYADLLTMMYELTGWDQRQHKIVMRCRFPMVGTDSIALEIKDDMSTKMMFGLYPRVYSVELFLEKEEVNIDKESSGFMSNGVYRGSTVRGDSNGPQDLVQHDGVRTSSPRDTIRVPCTPKERVSLGPTPEGDQAETQDHLQSSHGNGDDGASPSNPMPSAQSSEPSAGVQLKEDGGNVHLNERIGDDVLIRGTEGDQSEEEGDDWVDDAVVNNAPLKFEDDLPDEYQSDDWVDTAVARNNLPGFHDDPAPVGGGVHVGQIFEDKDALKLSLQEYAIRGNFQYRVVKSSKEALTVLCAREGCPWRIHSSVRRGKKQFKIRSYTDEHMCNNPRLDMGHRQCNSWFICRLIMPSIKHNSTMTPVQIQERVKAHYHIDVSYSRAAIAKKMALSAIYGDWKESYSRLPRYLRAVQEAIPGTVVHFQTDLENDGEGPKQRFECVFWSFAPSIAGFQHCRPLLCIDGVHLHGRYPGCMLVATSIDGNNGLFPLAFAIVESENRASWQWFLACIRDFVTGRDGLTIISDWQEGLMEAVASIYPPSIAHHRYCMRHLVDSFKKTFKDLELQNLFWLAAEKHEVSDFNKTMDLIERTNPEARRWMESLGVQHWSLAHDGGVRFGMMTTNLSQCCNSVLKGVRGLPIQALVAKTLNRLNKIFVKRQSDGLEFQALMTPMVEGLLRDNVNEDAKQYKLQQFSPTEFSVIIANGRQHTVNLEACTCTCNQFQMLHIPCSHAVAACSFSSENVSPYTFCAEWYTANAYRQTYAPIFHPVVDSSCWPPAEGWPMIPPSARIKHGRPPSVRIHTGMDREGRASYTCSRCRQPGHNVKKCRYLPPDMHQNPQNSN